MARAREDRLTDHHPLGRLVTDAMDELAADRPLFHSEADFQLALAWTIQRRHPTARIRLEQRLLRAPVVALDILVRLDHEAYALELKYVKSRLSVAVAEEQFQLAAGAPDVERYDVLKDVVRLERLVGDGVVQAGCALVLTNSRTFWTGSTHDRPTGYDSFRIHDGAELRGRLEWGATAGAGTRRAREQAIELRRSYPCRWRRYSRVDGSPAGELRYLSLLVT